MYELLGFGHGDVGICLELVYDVPDGAGCDLGGYSGCG